MDDVLDRVRFRIDTFPHGVYQPVPYLPLRSATRGEGSESRWDAMLPIVREQAVESAVDIGACEGYFSIMLGEAGIPTIALEGDPGASRTAMLAVRRSGLENVGVLALALTPENVVAVPSSDCTICLSIWHHFVRHNGLERATEMLETIWAGTRKVLFFDTGENEMTPEYRLPEMAPDPRFVALDLSRDDHDRIARGASRDACGVRSVGPPVRAQPVRGHSAVASR